MPKQYEAIRDRLEREGKSHDEVQSSAAAIYNSKHKNKPVTGSHKKKSKRKHGSDVHACSNCGSGIRDLY